MEVGRYGLQKFYAAHYCKGRIHKTNRIISWEIQPIDLLCGEIDCAALHCSILLFFLILQRMPGHLLTGEEKMAGVALPA